MERVEWEKIDRSDGDQWRIYVKDKLISIVNINNYYILYEKSQIGPWSGWVDINKSS